MGLTIHYSLHSKLTRVDEVRQLVRNLQQHARNLPFKEVGDLVEFKESEINRDDRDDPHRWLKIQAGSYVERGTHHFRVQPLHIVAFETWPGEGCEPANFGLCRYPGSMTVQDESGRQKTVRTGLTGWRWGSFCKTQYASDPACGGVENFVRCHLLVIQLLDQLARSGSCQVTVSDESDYWQHRDVRKLAETVGEWNEVIAAVVGQLKDAAGANGQTFEAAITQFSTFEHLEARGQQHLQKD